MILESYNIWQNQVDCLASRMQTRNLIIRRESLQVLLNLIQHLVYFTILKNSLLVKLAIVTQAKDALLWLALHEKFIHDVLFQIIWRHFEFFLFNASFWSIATSSFLSTTQDRQNFNVSNSLSEYFLICEIDRWLTYSSYNLDSFRNIVYTTRRRFIIHWVFLIRRGEELWVKDDCIDLSKMSLSILFDHRVSQSDFVWIQSSLRFHLLIVQWRFFCDTDESVALRFQLSSESLISVAETKNLWMNTKLCFLLLR